MAFEGIAARAERGELRLVAGEVGKPACPLLNRRGVQASHAVNAVREEQPAIRVHQPPFALHLLRAEEAGRPQARAGGPASKSVPIPGAGPAGKFLGLRLAPRLEVRDRFGLARPILVPVLAEGVYEGKELVGVLDPRRGRLVGARRANVPDVEQVVVAGLADEDDQLGDAARINGAVPPDPTG